MKKLIILLVAAGMIYTGDVFAQDTEEVVTVESTEADKISEEEAKRLQEEEEKAMKEYEKMLEEMEKDQKKYEKRLKREAKFKEFISTWEPIDYSDIDANTFPNIVNVFKYSNEFLATMAHVYSYIDYIHVETTDTVDAEGVEVTEVQELNQEGEDLKKGTGAITGVKATAELSLASLQASNVLLASPLAFQELTENPLIVLSIGKRLKKLVSTVKTGVSVIPLLRYKIQDNIAARKQLDNN